MPVLFSQHNGGVPTCYEIARDFFLGCSENFFLDRLPLTVLRVEDFRQRSGFGFIVRPQKLQRFFCRAQSASRVQTRTEPKTDVLRGNGWSHRRDLHELAHAWQTGAPNLSSAVL